MDNEAKLNLMKKRVIGSFKWQEDIIIPFSKEFGCTTEDLEDLFMDLLDMSSLEALHGTLEIANHKCLLERLDADLRLPWYVDVLELLSVEQGDELKNKVANEIIDGKSNDIALDEGRKDLFNLLKNINNEQSHCEVFEDAFGGEQDPLVLASQDKRIFIFQSLDDCNTTLEIRNSNAP